MQAKEIRSLLADGFDFPVGYPNGDGYYKARGYRPNGHLGEDWNGTGGGNTDLGDPVYAIGHGVVVFSKDHKLGWGNVVIIRHAYRGSDGRVHFVDSLYGHLHERTVRLYDRVRRGQKVGTIGTNKGMYWAHLHFEIRKNLNIGMSRSKYARDYSNYYSPTHFINDHRLMRKEYRTHLVAVDNFGTGAPNVTKGPPLARMPSPPVPVGKKPHINPGVEEILARNDLRKNSSTDTLIVRPGRSEEKEKKPLVSEEVAKLERDKIRAFWGLFRSKMREKDPGPIGEENIEQ